MYRAKLVSKNIIRKKFNKSSIVGGLEYYTRLISNKQLN